MSKRKYDDDDGRTIADMSGIEHRSISSSIRELKNRRQEGQGGEGISDDRSRLGSENDHADMKTRLQYTFGAVGAGLLIGMVYIVGFAIVIVIMLLIMGVL